MIPLTIKICDKTQKEPAFPEQAKKWKGELTDLHASVLEAGTVQGNTTIYLSGRTKDGGWYGMQLTANLLRTLVATIDGAEARWRVESRRN